jgi:O-antigen ligase
MGVNKAKAHKSKNPGPKYDLFNQLLLVVIIATVTTFPFIFDSFTVSKLFVLAIGLTFISIRLYLDKGPSLNQKIPMALSALICLLLLSIFVSWLVSGVPLTRGLIGQFGRGNGVLYYFFVILVFAFSVKTYRASSGQKMHELITLLSWFMAVYAGLQRIGIDIAKLDTKGISPVVLTFGNSNFAGGMLSVLFAYQLTYLVVSRSYRAPQMALLISLLISTTFAAAVQGYLIILFSMTLAITIILVRRYSSNWVRRSLIVAWGLGLVSVIMGVFGKFVFAQVFSRGSFQIRIEYWNIALNVIKDFPLFGVGPDKIYDVSSSYMAPGTLKIITATRLDNAHNWYLNFGVNFGLISLIILLTIFGWVFFVSTRLLKNLSSSNAISLSSLVAFISMFIDGLVSLEQPGIGVWLYLFAGVVAGANLKPNTKNSDQELIMNRKSNSSLLTLKVINVFLSALLFLSSFVLGNRILLDGMLRSNVQTALLNKGTPQTFSSIESLSVKLHSDPEYAAQALKPLAAIGDGAKLDAVSKAFYDYSPSSIQATLIRADVLRALNRVNDSCPLRATIIKNSPWDIKELSKYVDCYLGGFDYPDIKSDLRKAANYFSALDQSVIPADGNEVVEISSRLNLASERARVLFLIGDLESARSLQSYGKNLLARLIELQSLNPGLLLENQIAYHKNLLTFG